MGSFRSARKGKWTNSNLPAWKRVKTYNGDTADIILFCIQSVPNGCQWPAHLDTQGDNLRVVRDLTAVPNKLPLMLNYAVGHDPVAAHVSFPLGISHEAIKLSLSALPGSSPILPYCATSMAQAAPSVALAPIAAMTPTPATTATYKAPVVPIPKTMTVWQTQANGAKATLGFIYDTTFPKVNIPPRLDRDLPTTIWQTVRFGVAFTKRQIALVKQKIVNILEGTEKSIRHDVQKAFDIVGKGTKKK